MKYRERQRKREIGDGLAKLNEKKRDRQLKREIKDKGDIVSDLKIHRFSLRVRVSEYVCLVFS